MLKLKMMLCVMIFAAGRRRLHINESVSQCIEATTASGVDNANLPPTGEPLHGTGWHLPTPSGRSTCKKQLEEDEVY